MPKNLDPRISMAIDLKKNRLRIHRSTLRLLDLQEDLLRLGELGFTPDKETQFRKLLNRPAGLIIVCGPMNSGKSTTLYAALRDLPPGHGGKPSTRGRSTQFFSYLSSPYFLPISRILSTPMNFRYSLNSMIWPS